MGFCDHVTVLRRGREVGGGRVSELSTEDMARMMIGDTQVRERASRGQRAAGGMVLELAALFADDDEGLPALGQVSLKVHAGGNAGDLDGLRIQPGAACPAVWVS